MKKDKGTSMKITDYSKDLLNNVRATRRSVIKGESVDKDMLTQSETVDLIATYFKSKNDRYLELLKMEYVKNV